MDQFKEEIKAWLKMIKKDRHWLAENTYVSKATVDGWLSNRGQIPDAKLYIIKELMKKTLSPSSSHGENRNNWKAYSILLSVGDYALIEEAAKLDGLSVEEWSERELIKDAIRIKQKLESDDIGSNIEEFMAAEEPKKYGR